jgi:hypothetical protein
VTRRYAPPWERTAACSTPPTTAEHAFCARIGTNCGIVNALDNCGTTRTANCGTCNAPEFCGAQTPNVCGCSAGCGNPDAGSVAGPDAGPELDAGFHPDSGIASGCTSDTQCQNEFGAGYWCDPATLQCAWGCLSPPTCGAFCCTSGNCDTLTHACVAEPPDAGTSGDGGIIFAGDSGFILCNPNAASNCGCPSGMTCFSQGGIICSAIGICL